MLFPEGRGRELDSYGSCPGYALILLDEPTTYLDMAHQLEVLELLEELNKKQKKTIAMVLHDLNLAADFRTG